MPPTRMRSPSRVTATLKVSSITVDSGAIAASAIGTVIEKPLTGYTGRRMPSGFSSFGE